MSEEYLQTVFTIIEFYCSLCRGLPDETIEWLVNDTYQHTDDDGHTSEWKWTPLHYACQENDEEIVELLLKHKAGNIT